MSIVKPIFPERMPALLVKTEDAIERLLSLSPAPSWVQICNALLSSNPRQKNTIYGRGVKRDW
jgi:hypothetical protein